MKKIVIILVVILASISASAQVTTTERILNDVKRNAEWRIRSTINREIDRAIYDASNEAYKNRNAKKQGKVWTCPCCHTRNKGNFCPHCGQAKPVELTPWECPNCHRHNNGGIYCERCGEARIKETVKNEPTITLEQLSNLNKR